MHACSSIPYKSRTRMSSTVRSVVWRATASPADDVQFVRPSMCTLAKFDARSFGDTPFSRTAVSACPFIPCRSRTEQPPRPPVGDRERCVSRMRQIRVLTVLLQLTFFEQVNDPLVPAPSSLALDVCVASDGAENGQSRPRSDRRSAPRTDDKDGVLCFDKNSFHGVDSRREACGSATASIARRPDARPRSTTWQTRSWREAVARAHRPRRASCSHLRDAFGAYRARLHIRRAQMYAQAYSSVQSRARQQSRSTQSRSEHERPIRRPP
ncbi:hypothetical protein EXIGLDRAFT_101795 [Exidia glandulosa HHB12029]|uniref:Uncharacterized protein n=1 Tax=Exidia glandulosa HHB12029 TaxID=1314781 RepID=A0A165GYV7_EXIGL|nr:hypothetical protein EXIGLDRAFT_101795 [Exidia glandulosa HHB12029]